MTNKMFQEVWFLNAFVIVVFDVATKVEGLFTVPTLLEDVLAVRKWFTPCNSDGSNTLTPFSINNDVDLVY